jgi:hypothetical protein
MTGTEDTPDESNTEYVDADLPQRLSARERVADHPGHAAIVGALLVLFVVVLVWRLADQDEFTVEVTPQRPGDRCSGEIRHERTYQRAGEVVATSRVLYDESTGQACAKFTKAPDHALWEVTSYLAVELCNPQGECDADKHFYAREAGPVRISAGPSDCLSLHVSQVSEDERQYLVEPATMEVC